MDDVVAGGLSTPAKTLERVRLAPAQFVSSRRYRFADGRVSLFSEDSEFVERLGEIFGECGEDPSGPELTDLSCEIRISNVDRAVLLFFSDPRPLTPVEFLLSLLPDGRYVEIQSPDLGWRAIAARGESKPFAAFHQDVVVIDQGREWQAFTGHYLLHRALRIQRGILFFHAGSVASTGAGILFMGDEGKGKTTLSMTMASRGSAFLGDDLAAVRLGNHPDTPYEILPMRRSVSVRQGPRAAAVDQKLASAPRTVHSYPDGEIRVRAFARDLFPVGPPETVPLSAIFFLQGFAPEPRAHRLVPGSVPVNWLTPLASTVWGVAPAVRMMDFLRLLRRVPAFALTSGGSPEDTADLVEQTVRELWD